MTPAPAAEAVPPDAGRFSNRDNMLVPDETSAAVKANPASPASSAAPVISAVPRVSAHRCADVETKDERHLSPRSVVGADAANGEHSRAAAVQPATYLDVAVSELADWMQHDRRSVALVAHELTERFAGTAVPAGRLHELPGRARPEQVRRALAWCRRLVRAGRRAFLVLDDDALQAGFSQLREELCAENCPVCMIVASREPSRDGNRLVGKDHARPAIAWLRLLPQTIILSPKDGRELKQMLRLAAEQTGPVALYIPQGPLPEVQFPDFVEDVELGKAEIIEEGEEVVLLALGALVAPAVAAARELSQQGISAGVVNTRFVEPLDRALIGEMARGAKAVFALEEETASGGFGSAVLELLADEGINTPVSVSSAVGIHRNGHSEGELASQIARQAVSLLDRAIRDNPPSEPRSQRKRRPRRQSAGVDLFGFSLESLQRERDLVKCRRLSPEVEQWAEIYSLAGERQRFLWQWCEQGTELTTLPCVPPEFFAHVCQTKTLSIMLCVLLDDVADQRGRESLLEVLLKIVDGEPLPDLAGFTDAERHYAGITARLAEIYLARVKSYPCFAAFDRLLRYDQFQYFNTMRYSQMLNHNLWLLNPVEHDLYQPHNMDMMSFATIDLMCSPAFPIEELGRLREAIWHLQCMARIGNLLGTWRREIGQRDFTSGVFARAVVEGDLSVGQLRPDNFSQIEEAIVEGGHERYYFGRWKYHRECFLARARYVRAVDLSRLLVGNDRFFLMHLGGRGLL